MQVHFIYEHTNPSWVEYKSGGTTKTYVEVWILTISITQTEIPKLNFPAATQDRRGTKFIVISGHIVEKLLICLENCTLCTDLTCSASNSYECVHERLRALIQAGALKCKSLGVFFWYFMKCSERLPFLVAHLHASKTLNA